MRGRRFLTVRICLRPPRRTRPTRGRRAGGAGSCPRASSGSAPRTPPGEFVWAPHDGGVGHGRVGEQDRLELGRRDLEAVALISYLIRSVTVNQPSSSTVTMSPVWTQPSASIIAAVACGRRGIRASRTRIGSRALRARRGPCRIRSPGRPPGTRRLVAPARCRREGRARRPGTMWVPPPSSVIPYPCLMRQSIWSAQARARSVSSGAAPTVSVRRLAR